MNPNYNPWREQQKTSPLSSKKSWLSSVNNEKKLSVEIYACIYTAQALPSLKVARNIWAKLYVIFIGENTIYIIL